MRSYWRDSDYSDYQDIGSGGRKALLFAGGGLLFFFILFGGLILSGRAGSGRAGKTELSNPIPLSGQPSAPAGDKESALRISFSQYSQQEDKVKIYDGDYLGAEQARQIGEVSAEIKSLQKAKENAFVYIGGLDGMGRGAYISEVKSQKFPPEADQPKAEKVKTTDKNSKLNSNQSKQEQIIKAEEGWVIDQMYLSPDKTKIVTWEITDNFYLKKGKSRIVVYELGSLGSLSRLREENIKRRVLIEEEGRKGEVLYPVFWGKEGNSVYADTVSTVGKGINQGFFVIRGIGEIEEKRIEKVLDTGEYESTPILSPDGRKIAYTRNGNTEIVLKEILDKTNKTNKTYRPIEKAQYYNLVWGTERERIAVKAEGENQGNRGNKRDILIVLNVENGKVEEEIESFAGVFAWRRDDYILLAARVEGFGGVGGDFVQPGSLPAQGVYLYDLQTKKSRKVLSDGIISLIE